MAVVNWRAVLNGKWACKRVAAAARCAAHLYPVGFVFMGLCVSCETKGVEERKYRRLKRSNRRSPTQSIFPIYPRDIRKGLTNTHTVEITALGLLYVVCHCLGGVRFYRTTAIYHSY